MRPFVAVAARIPPPGVGLRPAASSDTRWAMDGDSRFSETERNAVYRAIFERRDVRNYLSGPGPRRGLGPDPRGRPPGALGGIHAALELCGPA